MIQIINISLIPSDNKPVVGVSQFDNVSRVLRFNVFDDLGMETPHVFDDGDTVLLNIRKNDNNIVVITGVIVSDIDPETQEVTGQYLTFELTEQACACVGSNYGEVSITSGDDEVIGSCNFKLIVERSPLSGGVSSQSAIDNLTTQIEDITEQVIGDNYYDKEEIDDKFDELDIPTKTSQLTNDSGFITASDIPTIPTKTSQLTNDSGFITDSDIPTIPTKTSQLTNDSGFTTIDDAATADDKTWSSDKISDEIINILPTGTASGSIANFNTSLALPMEIVADVNATQEAGTPTPQSPKAISGISEVVIGQQSGSVDVAACFRGLFKGTHGFINLGSFTWNYSTEGSRFSTTTAVSDISLASNFTNLVANGYHTISSAKAFSQMQNLDLKRSGSTGYINIRDDSFSGNATNFKNAMNSVYLIYELATPVTPTITPEQYQTLLTSFGINGSTTLINLGGTYYGGYVTQDKNGKRELVVTWKKEIYNGTQELKLANWRPTETSVGFAFDPSTYDGKYPTVIGGKANLVSNKLQNVSYAQLYNGLNDNALSVSTDKNYGIFMRIGDTSLTTSALINQYLAQNPIEVIYELAEPFTVALPDGEPINALVGVNNVYADSGDCEVTYKCSINEAINAALTRSSNRILSLMRSSETLETIEPIERGDNNENER